MKLLKFLFFFSIISFVLQAYDPHFVIVVASYNNRLWYKRNLDSIFYQNYPHYRVIYIDDISTDGTGDLVENYIKEVSYQGDFTLIKNTEKFLKVGNFYRAVHSCNDNEIIIELDGDDWFFDENVLSTLAKYYRNPDVWMTYGQYVNENVHRKYRMGKVNSVKSTLSKKIPEKVIEENGIRKYKWVTSHLRTFYSWLYKKIKFQDLILDDAFYSVTGDLAMAFPMVEMAGKHSRFVPDILYVYNNHSPLNDFRKRPAEQVFTEVLLRKKSPYKPLIKAEINSLGEYKNKKADIIYISKSSDALSQFLKDSKKLRSVGTVNIICAHDGYEEIQDSNIKIDKVHDNENAIMQAIKDYLPQASEDVVLINDAMKIPVGFDLNKAILMLEKTQTYSVLLHKNKNQVSSKQLITIFDDVSGWNLKYNDEQNCEDPYMVLYRAKDLRKNIEKSLSFDGGASSISGDAKFGLIINTEDAGR